MNELNKIKERIFSKESRIGIVGLGYVGLPLASLLAKKFRVTGIDISKERIAELKKGIDRTLEVTSKDELLQPNLQYSSDPADLKDCSVVIVAVPTPVDSFKKPDLGPVESASRAIGANIKKGTIVVFESTVYPGVTEDVCGKIIAQVSGLKRGEDFWLGYSPERVNPGDKERTIEKITKVVSGENPEVLDLLCNLYGSVIQAGIHPAQTIKAAEAAKVIENTQRDINIALINELAMIFEKIGLDTNDVLAAAGSKWNFLPFKPGLVGGHCIGVDPYYLTYLAEGLGIHPQIILAGRRINDNMGNFVAQKAVSMILSGSKDLQLPIRVGILGATFKENVPDIRNTKVVSICEELEKSGVQVFVVDPLADPEEFYHEYSRKLTTWGDLPTCDALILAVRHKEFVDNIKPDELIKKLSSQRIVLDIKDMLSRDAAKELGIRLWRL